MNNKIALDMVNKRYKVIKKEYINEKRKGYKEGAGLTAGSILGGGGITSVLLYEYIGKKSSLGCVISSIMAFSLLIGPGLFYNIMKYKYDENFIDITKEKDILKILKKELESNKNRFICVEKEDFDIEIKKLVK